MLDTINVMDNPYNAVGDGVADDTAAIQLAIDAASSGPVKTVVIPPGSYLVSATINHRQDVKVHGGGVAATFIHQSNDASPVWAFIPSAPATTSHAELRDVRFDGQPGLIPAIPEGEEGHEAYLEQLVLEREGVGVSVNEATFVTIRDVQIWDFVVGLDVSDGMPSVPGAFSGYHVVGPLLEVARCTTGIRALANANSVMIFGSRVFYSYGLDNEGVGIDVGSASGLTLMSNAIEAADLCLRIRDTGDQYLRVLVASNYLEPGVNPLSTPPLEGQGYDIVVDDIHNDSGNADGRVVQGFANVVSANRASAELRPSSIHHWDGPSAGPFGARFAGTAVPKRNLARNGGFGYYSTSSIPDWVVNQAEVSESNDHVTGVRSVQVAAATLPDVAASLVHEFVISDPAVEWITVGVRYKVLAGVGFSVSAVAGSNAAQRPDPVADAKSWKEMHVTVRRPAGSTTGGVVIFPDNVDGTGRCRIDEVWAVAGRYAVDSTQYAERIELLPAPLVIEGGAVNQSTTWGPVDILNLPGTLLAPLDDFSTAPLGVCGGIFRLRLQILDPTNPLLHSHNWLSITAPAAGTLIGPTQARVTAVYSYQPVEADFAVRTTSPMGEINRANANFPGTFEVSLVAWIVR